MKIKVCGVADKDNVQDLAHLDPDMLGFIFYPPSPRYMAELLKPEDLYLLNPAVIKAGVFVNPGKEEVMINLSRYGLDIIQLHGHESPAFCAGLREQGVDIIKAFRVDEYLDFNRLIHYVPYCRYFLFDSATKKYGGSGEKFPWSLLKRYELGHPFFLSGGISPGDEEVLLNFDHPSFVGIDMNSKFEVSPGKKNIEKLKVFINNIRKGQTE